MRYDRSYEEVRFSAFFGVGRRAVHWSHTFLQSGESCSPNAPERLVVTEGRTKVRRSRLNTGMKIWLEVLR